MAGVALGDICLRFVWQAWRLATPAFVLCGRRGAWRRLPSFCAAGVALYAVAGSRPACLQWRSNAIHASVALATMPLQAALRKMGAHAKMAKPLLRGVVFDLDGTLTVQNLDFKVMHERCGVPAGQDLLQAVAGMKGPDRHRAEEIIEEMEAEGRRTLQLAAGVIELGKFLQWWSLPTAIVTRNTQETVQSLHDQLWCPQSLPKFWPAVGREFVPPKPHPAALCHVPEPKIPSGWSSPTVLVLALLCGLFGLLLGLGIAVSLRLGWSKAISPVPSPGKGKKGLGVLGKTLELKD
eukprot:s1031_g25.t1